MQQPLNEYDIQLIAKTLGKASKNSKGWSCRCPSHDDKNPSLSLALGCNNQLLAKCHAGCNFQEIVAALKHRELLPTNGNGFSYGKSRREKSTNSNRNADEDDADKKQKIEYALKQWKVGRDPNNTPVQTYLNNRMRHLLLEIPSTIRYLANTQHSPTHTIHPCMLAAVTRWPETKVMGIHRTYLNGDSSGKAIVTPSKMMLGEISGGAVRLAPAIGDSLIIAEGIETALTLQLTLGIPAWAATSSSNMPNVLIPAFVNTLYFSCDNDDAGHKATRKAADKAWAEGRTVHILQPPQHINDFNELLLQGVTSSMVTNLIGDLNNDGNL